MAEDWQDWVGREERQSDFVTQGLVGRLRATLGSSPGEAAPFGLHWCLCLPDAPMEALSEDGHPRKGGFLPPIPLPRRMWASSEFEFHAPLQAGAVIERVARIESVTEKHGRSGRLAFVEVLAETHADGALAVRERQSVVYREAAVEPMVLAPVTQPDLSEWEASRTLIPDETLLFRFSALTFNSHRIHYDLPYTTSRESYPALIVHGPLTASLLLGLAEQELGRVSRATIRAVSPAFCNQPLHLVAQRGESGLDLQALGGNGRVVMQAQAC